MNMRHRTILLLLCLTPCVSIAQDIMGRGSKGYEVTTNQKDKEFPPSIWRSKHIDLCFTNMTMSENNQANYKTNFGAGFAVGCTYYLHKNAIANIFKLGLDATWVDLNYSNYNFHHESYWGTEKYQYHQAEYSMHVGISLHAMPIRKLLMTGYFHYVPTISSLYIDSSLYGNYGSFFCAGGSISYGVVGIGIETRFGNCSYKDLKNFTTIYKNTCNGLRTFISFKL